jgi:hypothetical protein
LEVWVKSLFTVTVGLLLTAIGLPADAQWLNHPTPNIPRTSSGKPNLAAPAPRGADGHPDLSGVWTTGPAVVIPISDEALTAKSKALVHEREENYFKDRPAFRCQPSGPATTVGWRRIIQTPSIITILYENLTYRVIFMDGRRLEADPARTWMGYSVGRWEGDTLVVDSFGFNDRTWLDPIGLPHTEALHTTERYRRRNLGQVQVELTVTDPGAFAKAWTVTQDLQFGADTEMVEAFCEDDQSHWIGRLSDVEHDAVTVPPVTLAKYVGVYSGLWGTRLRTVRIQLEGGTLYANGVADEKVRLVPQSETYFMATNGLSYDFDPAGNAAAFMVERHVSGDWRYMRQPER